MGYGMRDRRTRDGRKTVVDKPYNYERFNAVELLNRLGLCVPHIIFDPDMKHQYRIVRQVAHDGTLLFTRNLLDSVLSPVVNCESFWKTEPPKDGVTEVRYTVGWMRLLTAYGRVTVPAGIIAGEVQRAILPVRAHFFYGEKHDS